MARLRPPRPSGCRSGSAAPAGSAVSLAFIETRRYRWPSRVKLRAPAPSPNLTFAPHRHPIADVVGEQREPLLIAPLVEGFRPRGRGTRRHPAPAAGRAMRPILLIDRPVTHRAAPLRPSPPRCGRRPETPRRPQPWALGALVRRRRPAPRARPARPTARASADGEVHVLGDDVERAARGEGPRSTPSAGMFVESAALAGAYRAKKRRDRSRPWRRSASLRFAAMKLV